ncbi:divalent metal cation transporter [Patescibacteria group bacterium]|nr:divalent metal cation transporter [Patescibacteria group bacterium]
MGHTLSESKKIIKYPRKRRRHILDYFSASKEGIITGAADNDPAGIATFAQVGATTGFSLIWLLALITPLIIAVEEMSARIGVVTKKGLNTVIRNNYGAKLAITAGLIVFLCNMVTIGANIVAVSEIIGALTHINWAWLVLPITILISTFLIKNSYSSISKYLIIVTIALLFYVAAAFFIRIDTHALVTQLWPIQMTGSTIFLIAAVALLGTTISPYLIFWQTTEEVENKTSIKDLRKTHSGVALGFIYANLIALVIILLAASVFNGNTLIETTTEAATMLQPLAGDWAFLLFSFGIVGSGLIGIPVLAASTAYVGAEAFSWPEGLSKKIKKAKGFYSIMIGAILMGGLLALTHVPPMIMLLYTQVLNGLLTPILIILLMMISNNKKIMGKHTNRFWSNALGILSLVVMIGFDVLLLIKLF